MNTILALDIGTEYVKAVLAHAKKSRLEIIGTGKAKQESGSMWSGAISDISAVVATCEKALVSAEEQAGERASAVVVGIAGELVKGNTTAVHYTRENPNKPITESEMDEIIKKVQQKSGEVAKKTVALETGNNSVEIRLINSAIVSLTIDGYKISNPIGFKGSDVVIQFYTAFAPLIHIAAIEKVCAELNLDLLAVAVEPFAICRACLGENLDSNFSAIVMDVGGGTTDLAVITDGGVEGTKMFSIGGRSFTRQIAESLGLDTDTAEAYKLKLDDPALSDAVRAKIESAAARNLSVWLTGVEVALEDFNLSDILPSRILLCGGGASLSILQETLATSDWHENLPFARRPIVHLIESETLPGIKNLSKIPLDHSYATALGLLRVALDTLESAPENNTLRAKLSKLLQN